MAVAGAGVLWTSISLSFILTGTWINLLLYAFELLIGLHYLVRVRGWAKALLGATLLLDTVSTIFVCQIAWVLLLRPEQTSWNVEVSALIISILTALSGINEQLFFAYRLWTINRNRLLLSIVATCILATLVTVLTAIGIDMKHDTSDGGRRSPMTLISTVMTTFTNLVITVALVHKLHRIDFVRFSSSTRSLIRKVMVYAVACGCITAFVDILMTVLAFESAHGFILFFDCAGRVYAHTILLNFILFHNWQLPQDATSENPWRSGGFSLRSGVCQSLSHLPTLTLSQSTLSAMNSSRQGTVAETMKKPVPGPPFSMESIFNNSEEEL